MMKVSLKGNDKVVLKAIPGHFITPNSHVNYYLDMTTIKSRLSEASAAAVELSKRISPDTIVDTIVCMDGCEIIGAYLAEELTKAGVRYISEYYCCPYEKWLTSSLTGGGGGKQNQE